MFWELRPISATYHNLAGCGVLKAQQIKNYKLTDDGGARTYAFWQVILL